MACYRSRLRGKGRQRPRQSASTGDLDSISTGVWLTIEGRAGCDGLVVEVLDKHQAVTQTEVLRRLGPEGRLKAGLRLYWSARKLKTAMVRQQHPDWTREEVDQAVREIFMYART